MWSDSSRPSERPAARQYLGESGVLRGPDTFPQQQLPELPVCGGLCAGLGVRGTKMNQVFVKWRETQTAPSLGLLLYFPKQEVACS